MKLCGCEVRLEVMATTIISVVLRLYVSLETTITGRRRVEDRSVKGTGTSTMSLWLGIIPLRVILRVIPKICAGGRGLYQILELILLCENHHFHPTARRQGKRHLDLPARFDLCRESVSFLRHVNLLVFTCIILGPSRPTVKLVSQSYFDRGAQQQSAGAEGADEYPRQIRPAQPPCQRVRC